VHEVRAHRRQCQSQSNRTSPLLRLARCWRAVAPWMKVVRLNKVGERPNCAEIRLGVTWYNIEMKRCCRAAETDRTGCQPIGVRCSLLLGISSRRDRTSPHLCNVYTHVEPIKLFFVDALIRLLCRLLTWIALYILWRCFVCDVLLHKIWVYINALYKLYFFLTNLFIYLLVESLCHLWTCDLTLSPINLFWKILAYNY